MYFIKLLTGILLLLNLSVYSRGQAKNGRIFGEVVDKQSQIRLPGVNIILSAPGVSRGTVSDQHGQFILTDIPVGRFNIEFSYIGYEKSALHNVALTSGKDVFLNIELLEKVEAIDEVVVKTYLKEKPINEFATISARSFSVDETNKYAGSWGDPARMVSNYAGVITAGDQRNDIIIRGNAPTGLLWRLEGTVIPNPNHFGTFGTTGGPISILNNNQLTNSDFFSGAFPAEFGNALSGVFDLKMRNGNTQKHEFTAGMGFNGFELGAEGPIIKTKGSSYMIHYRYTMMDLMAAMGMFDVGGIPKYSDVSCKILLPSEKLGTFSLFGLGGISQIKLNEDPVNEEDENDTQSGWTSDMLPGTNVLYGSKMGVIGLTNRYFISEKERIESSVSVSYSGSFNEVDTLRENTFADYYDDRYTEIRYVASSRYIVKPNPKNVFQTGISAEIFDFNFCDNAYEFTLDSFIHYTNIKGNALLFQAFAQMKHRVTDAFSVHAGLHGQLFSLNNSKILEPRFGLNYAINNRHSLSFGYGFHGQIQPRLIYFTNTYNEIDDVNILTNKNLEFSKSHHLVAGYNYMITRNLRLKLEAYYQYLFNIPVEQRPSTFSMLNYGANFYNEKVDSLVNEGTGKNAGIEFTLEKFLNKHFYFLLTASIFDSKYQGSDNIWRNTAFNCNYVVNFLAGYDLPIKHHELSVNIKAVTAGGKRYVPIDPDLSLEKGEAVYDYSHAYSNRFDDYFRIDFRLSFRQNLKKISQEFSFDIQNMTDHANVLAQKYDPGKNEIFTIFQTEFFPIMSWKLYFNAGKGKE